MGFIEKRTGITPREIVGNHLHTDLSWKGAGKTGVLGLSAASAVFGVIDPGAGMIAAQVVGLAGAMYFVGSTVASGTKALSPKKYK
jgi:hypothetical protein